MKQAFFVVMLLASDFYWLENTTYIQAIKAAIAEVRDMTAAEITAEYKHWQTTF